MILTKAIEIMDLNIKSVGKQMPTDTLVALKIVTEAAKRIQYQRTMKAPINQPLLRGESL